MENLIEKYLEGKASMEEINQIDKWYASFDCRAGLYAPGSRELNEVIVKRFSELKLKLGIF